VRGVSEEEIERRRRLAIRFSGLHANAAREMRIAPLSNQKLVRDLIAEIAPPGERFGGR
jgi:succinate dehydrogenase/fumarate reductase-like Fe-S protein